MERNAVKWGMILVVALVAGSASTQAVHAQCTAVGFFAEVCPGNDTFPVSSHENGLFHAYVEVHRDCMLVLLADIPQAQGCAFMLFDSADTPDLAFFYPKGVTTAEPSYEGRLFYPIAEAEQISLEDTEIGWFLPGSGSALDFEGRGAAFWCRITCQTPELSTTVILQGTLRCIDAPSFTDALSDISSPPIASEPTAVSPVSWGEIKAKFR